MEQVAKQLDFGQDTEISPHYLEIEPNLSDWKICYFPDLSVTDLNEILDTLLNDKAKRPDYNQLIDHESSLLSHTWTRFSVWIQETCPILTRDGSFIASLISLQLGIVRSLGYQPLLDASPVQGGTMVGGGLILLGLSKGTQKALAHRHSTHKELHEYLFGEESECAFCQNTFTKPTNYKQWQEKVELHYNLWNSLENPPKALKQKMVASLCHPTQL